MRTIKEILFVERWQKDGRIYHRTHAILDNNEEAKGFGTDFIVGDKVEAFFDDKWDTYKMIKPKEKI